MDRRGFLFCAASAAIAGAAFGAAGQTPVAAPAPVTPAPAPVPAAPVAPPPELEAIRAVTIGRRGVTVRLVSHGCTRKGDIAYFVERKAGVTTLAFGRKRIEMCGRGRPGETTLDFAFKDLGIDPDEPVVVLNPLLAAKAPVRAVRRR